MAQPTTMTTLRRHYSLLFSWINEHINEHFCRDDFVTFIGLFDLSEPQNLTSRPIPSINLPSTLPTNTSITSFRRSSSRAMSPSTTAGASPVLCHRSPTLIIENARDFLPEWSTPPFSDWGWSISDSNPTPSLHPTSPHWPPLPMSLPATPPPPMSPPPPMFPPPATPPHCPRLLQNRPGRLIHIMDDQARHTLKKTTP